MRPTFTRRCQLIPSYCSDLFPSPFVVFSPPIIALPSSYQEIDDGLRQPPEKITHSFNEEVKAHPRRRTSLMTSLVFKKKISRFSLAVAITSFFCLSFSSPFLFSLPFFAQDLLRGVSRWLVVLTPVQRKTKTKSTFIFLSLWTLNLSLVS